MVAMVCDIQNINIGLNMFALVTTDSNRDENIGALKLLM